MKLQVIINEELLKLMDARCKFQACDRSEFIRHCIRAELFGAIPVNCTDDQLKEAIRVAPTSTDKNEVFKNLKKQVESGKREEVVDVSYGEIKFTPPTPPEEPEFTYSKDYQ